MKFKRQKSPKNEMFLKIKHQVHAETIVFFLVEPIFKYEKVVIPPNFLLKILVHLGNVSGLLSLVALTQKCKIRRI